MKSGIYKIVNRVNGKYYVGSSNNIGWRTYSHFHKLKLGKHENSHLQNAWNKYGESAFEIVIVEELPKELLLITEQKYLDLAKIDTQTYNMCYIAGCGPGHKKGVKFSPSHIQNLRISHRGQTAWNRGKTKDQTPSIKRMSLSKTGRSNDKIAKNYWFVNPTGETIHIHNLQEYCKNNGLNGTTMNLLFHGKRGYKSHRGWTRCQPNPLE